MTRESLPALICIAEEIYGVENYEGKIKPEIVITEDSNSEYRFFNNICKKENIKCDSMGN